MRRSRTHAVAVLAVVALAACGGSDGEAGTTATEPTEDVTLRVLMADDWASTAPVNDVIRQFEADHPGVLVQIEGLPFSQIVDSVRVAQETGTVPDVVQWHAFAAGAQDLALPLDDLWEEFLDEDDFLPGAIEDVTWGDRKYGVPLDTSALFLLVNGDLFAEKGLDTSGPATFDTVREWAQAVTDADVDRRGTALSLSTWATFGWMASNGGELLSFDDNGDVVLTIDAPENVEALDFLGSLVTDGLAYEPSRAHQSLDAFELFRNEFAGFLASGSWDLASLADEVGWEPVAVPMPQGATGATSGTVLGGSSLFVPAGSANRELAFQFMAALVEDDIALRLAKEEGRLPARHRVFDDEFFDSPGLAVVADVIDDARVMNLLAYPESIDAFARAVEDVLSGRSDATTALAAAQAVAEAEAMG